MLGLGAPEVMTLIVLAAIYGIFIPINVKMAKKRNMSVPAVVVLTLLFVWIVSVVLLFIRKPAKTEVR